MALGITKTYTPSSGQATDASAYNTDLAALFNAFSGLEAQTSSLGGLTITPTADSTTTFKITNAAGTELLSANTTNSQLKLKATSRLYFDGGGDTYITESSSNVLDFYTGGTLSLRMALRTIEGATSYYQHIINNRLYLGDTTSTTRIQYNGTTDFDFYISDVSYFTITTTYSYTPNVVRIGTNAANNGIDDATGGTGSTPLYIGNQIIGTSTGTTGGTGSAGSGKQYVQLKIGATTYKVLVDGTV